MCREEGIGPASEFPEVMENMSELYQESVRNDRREDVDGVVDYAHADLQEYWNQS